MFNKKLKGLQREVRNLKDDVENYKFHIQQIEKTIKEKGTLGSKIEEIKNNIKFMKDINKD